MKEKNNCKIVQDLLPNYIEKLTEKETNQYIEEHLKECNECQKIYDNMEVEVNFSQDKNVKKNINILKKYNMKLNIFKSIVIIILLIFFFHVTRNMVIISSIKKHRNEYKNIDNYSINSFNYFFEYDSEKSEFVRTNIYQNGDKALIDRHITRLGTSDTMVTRWRDYYNGDTLNIYFDSNNNYKNAQLNMQGSYEGYFTIDIINFENPIDLLLTSIYSSIKSEICNGKQCYRISNLPEYTNDALIDVLYIEKDTGLTTRYVSKSVSSSYSSYDDTEKIEKQEQIINYEYSFNTVTDDIFIEPDISKYETNQ